jgi:NADH pyrophosphatase NudC (nudix superfamily)
MPWKDPKSRLQCYFAKLLVKSKKKPASDATTSECCYTGVMSYNNPIPVSVAMVFNSDRSKVLVGERTIEPFIGGDALIGGYAEAGETAEAAVHREAREETGRNIDACPMHYESSAATANNRMLLFFSTTAPEMLFDGVEDSNEMRNIRFITPEQLQAKPLCFSLHQAALLDAWAEHRPDLFPNPEPTPS